MNLNEKIAKAKQDSKYTDTANKSIILHIKHQLGRGSEVIQEGARRLHIKQTWNARKLKYELSERISFKSKLFYDLNKSDQTILDWLNQTIDNYKACQRRITEIEAALSNRNFKFNASYYRDHYELEISYVDKMTHYIPKLKLSYDQDPAEAVTKAIAADKAEMLNYFETLIFSSIANQHSGAEQLIELLSIKHGGYFSYTVNKCEEGHIIYILADGIELKQFLIEEDFIFYSILDYYDEISSIYETYKQTKEQIYSLANTVNQSPNGMWECHVIAKRELIIQMNLVTHPKIKSLTKIQIGGDVKSGFTECMRYLLSELRSRGFYQIFSGEVIMNDGS